MIANHPEREQIRLENVLFALGNPLRLEIIRILADGSEQSCNALRHEDVAKSTMTHHWRVLRDSGDLAAASGAGEFDFAAPGRFRRALSRPAGYAA